MSSFPRLGLNEYNRLSGLFDEMFITDGKGIVLKHCLDGSEKQNWIKQRVFELEKQKVFWPSATARVLESKKRQVVLQQTASGRELLVLSSPCINNKGAIFKVISFSVDVSNQSREYYNALKWVKQQSNNKTETPSLINGSSMQNIIDMANKLALVDSTVFITGESGVGKEVLARLIHSKSDRRNKSFVPVNCGAIPVSLFESEFFGYQGGAFTDAKSNGKKGLVEEANGGTLFLDEVSELPLDLQVKLLRFIQFQEFRRVGDVEKRAVDIRLIAASNKNIAQLVREGKFREDLYYRLNVVPIHIPPLRERKDEIPNFIFNTIDKLNFKYQQSKTISPTAINALLRYPWPGNIRELENIVEQVFILETNDVLDIEDLPKNIINCNNKEEDLSEYIQIAKPLPLRKAIDFTEETILRLAKIKCNTTREIAKLLKVDQSTIVRKLNKYGVK